MNDTEYSGGAENGRRNGKNTGQRVLFASVLTAIMSALAVVLMKLEISVPIMPAFIKFDFSDFPAMFTGIAAGPLWGVLVCLLKNLLHIVFGSSTGGIGEIANFAIGAAYVLTASLIYRKTGGRKGMLIGGAAGSVAMAAVAYPVNLFVVYPLYMKFMPLQSIIDAYSAINPAVTGLPQALLVFNTPFNVIKGVILTVVAILTYSVTKPLFELIEKKIRC